MCGFELLAWWSMVTSLYHCIMTLKIKFLCLTFIISAMDGWRPLIMNYEALDVWLCLTGLMIPIHKKDSVDALQEESVCPGQVFGEDPHKSDSL
jgi:hypothetical protein